MYNFNSADWPSIKSELDSVNWASVMDSIEPDIGLYDDDTKLSRKIETWSDCDILQRDIDTLNNWCISNN